MFDHIYQQQDFYSHYESELAKKENSKINVKAPELPFSSLLCNIGKFIKTDTKESLGFPNLLIQNNQISIENLLSKSVQFESDLIILIVSTISLCINHFCETTLKLISSTTVDSSQLFLNEYLKRYKSFIDFAMSFQTSYQNINATVNILSETCKSNLICSNFSLLRMFVSTAK